LTWAVWIETKSSVSQSAYRQQQHIDAIGTLDEILGYCTHLRPIDFSSESWLSTDRARVL